MKHFLNLNCYFITIIILSLKILIAMKYLNCDNYKSYQMKKLLLTSITGLEKKNNKQNY